MIQIEKTYSPSARDSFLITTTEGDQCEVGLTVSSLLTQTLYIWFAPKTPLRRNALRTLRRHFDTEFAGLRVQCNVDKHNHTAIRFAQFFGFVQVETVAHVLLMEREL